MVYAHGNGTALESRSEGLTFGKGITGNDYINVAGDLANDAIPQKTADQIGVAATLEKVAEVGQRDDRSTCCQFAMGQL